MEQDPGGVLAAVSTRVGGVSNGPYRELNLAYHVGDDPGAVGTNRLRLCAALGVKDLTVADQQHRSNVAVVDDHLRGAGYGSQEDAEVRLRATDGMVTDLPGVALAVMVADCAPLVLFDPATPALGVAHVGRGGAVLDVVGTTIGAMAEHHGTDPGAVWAGVGPCIGAAHYEIGGPALEATAAAFPRNLLTPTSPGHASFDLLGAVLLRLDQAGVRPANVEVTGMDTFERTDKFFSDRAVRPCGRFMLVASLTLNQA